MSHLDTVVEAIKQAPSTFVNYVKPLDPLFVPMVLGPYEREGGFDNEFIEMCDQPFSKIKSKIVRFDTDMHPQYDTWRDTRPHAEIYIGRSYLLWDCPYSPGSPSRSAVLTAHLSRAGVIERRGHVAHIGLDAWAVKREFRTALDKIVAETGEFPGELRARIGGVLSLTSPIEDGRYLAQWIDENYR